MNKQIRQRLMIIGVLIVASVWALLPRNVTQRVVDRRPAG